MFTNKNVTLFTFPADTNWEEILEGNQVLDWMDEEIKKSPFIDINLLTMGRSEITGSYSIAYEVIPRLKINCQYMFRHLALQNTLTN